MTEITEGENEADVEGSDNEDIEVFEDDFQQRVVSVAKTSQLKRPTYLDSNTSPRLLASRQRLPRSKSISAYGVKDPDPPRSDPAAVSDGGGVSPKANVPKIEDKKVSLLIFNNFHVQ